ncbi:MAG: riboflavin kinase [Nevskiales bacterium]
MMRTLVCETNGQGSTNRQESRLERPQGARRGEKSRMPTANTFPAVRKKSLVKQGVFYVWNPIGSTNWGKVTCPKPKRKRHVSTKSW